MTDYLIAERTSRIGHQRLVRAAMSGRYFVTIRNRTYASRVEVPADKIMVWRRLLR